VLHGEVLEQRFFGRRVMRFWTDEPRPVIELIEAIGHIPLPPYIKRPDLDIDRDRYQTIFARESGSIAAPTAGLHFTDAILESLEQAGVERTVITLHVGYGTFKPVRETEVEAHTVDPERYAISAGAAARINRAIDNRRRIVAVGTTTTRAIETAVARGGGHVDAGSADTSLFIFPGHRFRAVGALVTNFHLPASSLLMLVSAFAGRDAVLDAYREAVRERYRFYSYGDAMLIV
jgi:S-adenosylmethionine:tRNA ribosyltransferase-isomerase